MSDTVRATHADHPHGAAQAPYRILIVDDDPDMSAYLALLLEHSPLLPRLAQIVAASAWASDYLCRHPILLDELLDARVLFAPPDLDAWPEQLRRELDGDEADTERRMDVFRHFQHTQTFRLLAQDVTGQLTVERLADYLSALADLILSAALRDYIDGLDVDAAHRDALELRFDKLKALMRKYGGSADEVLAYLEEARLRLTALEEFAADEESLVAKVTDAQEEAVAAAARLGEARRRLAPEVAARIEEELRGLAMPHATFRIEVAPRGGAWEGLGPSGADDVEFVFGANPGVPPRPLRETASGGELSRAMLAIRGLVTLGDDVETLIFDEVDTGIGGVTAAALGERLRRLAERRQVLCITHLPQVAAFADRQFAIAKESAADAGSTETAVRLVEGDERLAELCRMLGAAADDGAARSHAESLLARASAGS